jgi:hypothetical protein
MRLTVEKRVFILESYLKTMSYAHCRQSSFEKFRRQVPVKSAIVKNYFKNSVKQVHFWTRIIIGRKVARNMAKHVDKCSEMNGHHFQHLL